MTDRNLPRGVAERDMVQRIAERLRRRYGISGRGMKHILVTLRPVICRDALLEAAKAWSNEFGDCRVQLHNSGDVHEERFDMVGWLRTLAGERDDG